MRLKDKVAIIVGGGQMKGETIGNGRAMAVLFAREGAKVLIVDHSNESAMETKEIIEKEGGAAEVFIVDIIFEESSIKLVQKCLELYGRIDIVVNDVGIMGFGDNSVDKLSQESWDKLMNVNIRGMFFVCKHVIPVMIEQQSGSIVNISSIAAVTKASGVAYHVSKAGVNALTQDMAIDNAKHGIRINAIMPGFMRTPMAIEGNPLIKTITKDELIQRRNLAVPLKGGMGTGWDTAYAALFLASDEAKFITAVILPVDGGFGSAPYCNLCLN